MRKEEQVSEENNTREAPEPERYYVEYVELTEVGGSVATLQEVINVGTRKSWKLIGVAQDPVGSGVIVVWDQSGFISG